MDFILITSKGIMLDSYFDGLEHVLNINESGNISENVVSMGNQYSLYSVVV